MKLHVLLVTLVIFCVSATAFAQQAKLEGRVVDDKDKPVPGARITAAGGQAALSDSKGRFRIEFPAPVQPGQAIRLAVVKTNWVIYEPLLGNCVTQSSARNFELQQVIIVPKGSPLALTPKRLGQVIARWAGERAKLQGQVASLSSERDEYVFLREYAEQYGFTLEQFVKAAQQWAESKESDDQEEQALREYFLKNYARAAQLAHESALAADEDLGRTNKKKVEDSLKVIRRFKLEGNSFYEQSKFREALTAYREIDNRFLTRRLSKDDLIREWAELRVLLGNARQRLGIRVANEESQILLAESVENYRQALQIYRREQFPQDWASTHLSLGGALAAQGERLAGEDSLRLLSQAVEAFESVLQIKTREENPVEWGMAQNNLGVVFLVQGERLPGAEGRRLFEQAVKACQTALEVRTRGQRRLEWAESQNNLGNVLEKQGDRLEGPEGMRLNTQAAAAYLLALEVYTLKEYPEEWAATQNNLGGALSSQGERLDGNEGVRLLGQAIEAYRKALQVHSREHLPQQWAATQTNIAIALSAQGERLVGAEGLALLDQAIEVMRAVLQVYTGERMTQQWAATQYNLGNMLQRRGERLDGLEGMELLREAIEAYRGALRIRTRETQPQQWASTQNNFAITLIAMGRRSIGEEKERLFKQVVEIYRALLEVRTREEAPLQWAAIQNNLGNLLSSLGAQREGEERKRLLIDAVEAYLACLQVRTREQTPQKWAATYNNLAPVYLQLHDWLGAADAYRNVLTVDADDKEAYEVATGLYHDRLFKFDAAFALTEQWLARHQDDLAAQSTFAENHFTSGRFSECADRISALVAKPGIPADTKVALSAIGIANLLALNEASQVPAKIEALIVEVSGQPPAFKLDWSFDGSRHFIKENEKLAPYRAWLDQLFEALANQDRDTISTALRDVQKRFKTQKVTPSVRAFVNGAEQRVRAAGFTGTAG